MDDLNPASMFYAINGRRTPSDPPSKTTAGIVKQEAETRRKHAEQDHEMQLMLLEQQNKKRLLMARQEQEAMEASGRSDARVATSQHHSLPYYQAALDLRRQNEQQQRRDEAQAREQWERIAERRLGVKRVLGKETRPRRLFGPPEEQSSPSGNHKQSSAPYTQATLHYERRFSGKNDTLLERSPGHNEGDRERQHEPSTLQGSMRKTQRLRALEEEVAALTEANATSSTRKKMMPTVPTTISQDCTATAELQQSVLLKRLLKQMSPRRRHCQARRHA